MAPRVLLLIKKSAGNQAGGACESPSCQGRDGGGGGQLLAARNPEISDAALRPHKQLARNEESIDFVRESPLEHSQLSPHRTPGQVQWARHAAPTTHRHAIAWSATCSTRRCFLASAALPDEAEESL
jgi:hypothetical protein